MSFFPEMLHSTKSVNFSQMYNFLLLTQCLRGRGVEPFGVSHANAILTKQRNRLNLDERSDLLLKLINL